MGKITGSQIISGTHGVMWIDNQEIMEMSKVTCDVNVDREDVLLGMGKDSKIVSMSGEGSFTVEKVFSRASAIFKDLKKGKDKRVTITFQYQDPDSPGEQIERWTVNGCWFNKLTIANIEKGAKVQEEYPFGFNPDLLESEEDIK
ncbi:MAG: phage tail tube protein [Fusobacteriaceae bacterium]